VAVIEHLLRREGSDGFGGVVAGSPFSSGG